MTGCLLDKAAHRLAVVSLITFEDNAVSGPSDDAQMALFQPVAERVHIASGCRLTDSQHLTVIEKLARRPVPEKFKEKSSSPSFAVRRVRILLFSQVLFQFDEVLDVSFQYYALALIVNKFQVVFPNAELKILELSLHCPLGDAQLLSDLLLSDRPPIGQQDLQHL